ncbi:MAG: amidohydrolase [Armatimonadota bacterium]|nr:amidohydrolase [Armatimonadota bacterium]
MRDGTVFYNAHVYTLDKTRPRAEAIALRGERIIAVGASADLRAAFPSFRHIDLEGRVVLPGFVDSHVHLLDFALGQRGIDLSMARSLGEATARLAEGLEGDGWVLGQGWDPNLWPEQRLPTRCDLDAVLPGRPVALRSKDGHLLWVNSLALHLAGISRETQDPPGGTILRDPFGEPLGILKEKAQELIWRVVPPPSPAEVEEVLRNAMASAHRYGLVGIHDMEGPEVFRGFQRLERKGLLTLRVTMMLPERALAAAVAAGLTTGFGSLWLRVGGIKIFADGTLGSQTASMLEPFQGQPGNYGIPVHTREELVTLIREAVRGGFSVAVHAIGDRANRWALDAIEANLEDSRNQGLRHRIEHVQLLHPKDLPRLALLGVVASMQPAHATYDRDLAERYWGRRARYAYAWRSILNSGAVLAFGSDTPYGVPDPMAGLNPFRGIYAAVTRKREDEPASAGWHPEECLTVEEAIRAYTIGAAYASGEERYRGVLSEGYLADFVVLNQDPFRLSTPEELLAVKVEATVVGGEIRFVDPELSGLPVTPGSV